MVPEGAARVRSGAANVLFAARRLNFLQGGRIRGRLDPNCVKGAKEQQACDPELGPRKVVVEEEHGKSQSAGRAYQLKSWRKGAAQLANGDVIQLGGEH